MLRHFCIWLLICALLLPGSGSWAQLPDSIKVVALLPPAKRAYYAGYTVDSLVAALNSSNSNPRLRFVRCTEDETRSGFYADYVVDISFTLTRPYTTPPSTRRVAEEQAVSGGRSGGRRGSALDPPPATRTVYRSVYEPGTSVAGTGSCFISIREKKRHEAHSSHSFRTEGPDAALLEQELIEGVLRYLLERFAK
jgi:hypothetical protein